MSNNNETHHHLAQFKVHEVGAVWVPLSSIASIIYNEDEDLWAVNTIDGGEFNVIDEKGQGIHSIVQDIVTWQVKPQVGQDLGAVLKALQERVRAGEGYPGGEAS